MTMDNTSPIVADLDPALTERLTARLLSSAALKVGALASAPVVLAVASREAGNFTADELARLDALTCEQAHLVKTLYAFLDATQQVGKSAIAALPLELAVTKLSGGVV